MKFLIIFPLFFSSLLFANDIPLADCSNGRLYVNGLSNYLFIETNNSNEVNSLKAFYGLGKPLGNKMGELFHSNVRLLGGSFWYKEEKRSGPTVEGYKYWKVLEGAYFNNNGGSPYDIGLSIKWGKGAKQPLAFRGGSVSVKILHFDKLDKKLRKVKASAIVKIKDCRLFDTNISTFMKLTGGKVKSGK